MSPEGLSRRDFNTRAIVTLAALSLLGCESPNSSGTVLGVDTQPATLQMGDVITVEGKAFLLREQKAYPILDLEKYKRFSKLAEYGRRIVQAPVAILNKYPLGKVLPPSMLAVVDPFTGDLKDPKTFGGEMNVYFAGFMTDGGAVSDIVEPGKTTFVRIREGLQSKNWRLLNSLFFTYGEEGFDRYQAVNTARSPKENITHALDFFKLVKETYPLVQFNLFGHSLGGIFALEVARENPDAVNNLVLINSPIRGIEGNFIRRALLAWGKDQAKKLVPYLDVTKEEVTDYLFNLWEDKNYQSDLEKFAQSFTKMGRNFVTISATDDPIVPKEAATVKGAKLRSVSVGNVPTLQYLEAHGRPLKNKEVVDFIAQTVGENIVT